MSNRTPFVLSSVAVTTALGVAAFIGCYSQEAARTARTSISAMSADGGNSEQLADAPLGARLAPPER
jgi:hypothetical protein